MPRGINDWNDLLNVKRWRQAGDLTKLRSKLWRAIVAAELGADRAMRAEDGDDLRRWLHCVCQLSAAYHRVIIDAELEQRVQTLEENLRHAAA